MLPQNAFEWTMLVWFYATQFVLPILVLVAVILVIVRMVGGVKVRGLSAKGEQAVADAAARATKSAVADVAPKAVLALREDALRVDLVRARTELALADKGLTKRERSVLCSMRAGNTLAAIAEELGVSRSTVGTYCARAYEKLGVSSKDEACAVVARIENEAALRSRGLTERETEVALLAVDGLSASAIAEKLVLSEATVASHLGRAYAKLDVHSREELISALSAMSDSSGARTRGGNPLNG